MATTKKAAKTNAAKHMATLMKTPQTAVLLAFSSSQSVNSDDYFGCVEAGFAAVGKKNLTTETEIIWPSFSAPQVRNIGRTIERCLDAKGFDCPPLAGSFEVLREESRTTIVSDLIQALIDLTD